MKRLLLIFTLLLQFNLVLVLSANATHLRSGHIKVQQIDNLRVRVTIEIYTDTNTPVRFGEGLLDFGDGSDAIMLPIIENNTSTILNADGSMTTAPFNVEGLGEEVAIASFTIEYTYGSAGQYLVSYVEPNRNSGIININNSINTPLFVESLITLDPSSTYRSPELLTTQIFRFPQEPTGNIFSKSLGANDPNDYKLRYEIVTPKQEIDLDVDGYRMLPGVGINKLNGLFTWDYTTTEVFIGEYVFAVKISQFDGNNLVGYMTVDYQVLVDDGGESMTLTDNLNANEDNRIVVTEGNETQFNITAEAEIAENITLEAFGTLFDSENAIFTISDNIAQKTGTLRLISTSDIIRDNPYVLTLRATYVPEQGAPIVEDINYLLYTRDIEDVDPIIQQVTSITQSVDTHVQMYPNPTDDVLEINWGNQSSGDVLLYGMDGSMLMSKDFFETNNLFLDLSEFESGVYFLVLQLNGKESIQRRLVKP